MKKWEIYFVYAKKENSICNALLPTDGLDSLTYTVFFGVLYTKLLEHAHGVPVRSKISIWLYENGLVYLAFDGILIF